MKKEQTIPEEREEGWLRKQLTTYGLLILGALSLVWLFSGYRGFFLGAGVKQNAAALSDGFFVTGVIFSGIGLLVWVSSTGFFDMLSYGFRNLAVLTPFRYKKKIKPFWEFKEEQRAKRKPHSNAVLFVGLAMIALAAISLAVYMNNK